MKRLLPLAATVLTLQVATPSFASSPGCGKDPKVHVQCPRNSGLLTLNVTSCRKIGNVVIEVRDANGRTLYREEGKAMTAELVRRLDRGTFPKGELTLLITARDLQLSERVVNE